MAPSPQATLHPTHFDHLPSSHGELVALIRHKQIDQIAPGIDIDRVASLIHLMATTDAIIENNRHTPHLATYNYLLWQLRNHHKNLINPAPTHTEFCAATAATAIPLKLHKRFVVIIPRRLLSQTHHKEIIDVTTEAEFKWLQEKTSPHRDKISLIETQLTESGTNELIDQFNATIYAKKFAEIFLTHQNTSSNECIADMIKAGLATATGKPYRDLRAIKRIAINKGWLAADELATETHRKVTLDQNAFRFISDVARGERITVDEAINRVIRDFQRILVSRTESNRHIHQG